MSSIPAGLDTLITQAQQSRKRGRLIGWAMRHMGLWVGLLLLIVVIDALIGLPLWGLLFSDGLLIATALVGVIHLIKIAFGSSSKASIARDLEAASGLRGSELINAVQLSTDSAASGSTCLRAEAISLGEQSATGIDQSSLVDRVLINRGLRLLAITLLILAIGWLALPGVFRSVFPRLIAPMGDLPAYTWLTFDVDIHPTPVLHGKSVIIDATIDSPTSVPQEVNLIFDEDDHHPEQTIRMMLSSQRDEESQSSAVFRVQLARAEASRTFYIETSQGRSQRYQLDVLPVPQIEAINVSYEYPAYTGWEPRAHALNDRGVRGIKGSIATIEVECSLPIESGMLTWTPDNADETQAVGYQLSVTVDASQPTRITVPITLEQDGRFEIELMGYNNIPADRSVISSVVVVEDAAPRIQVRKPSERVVAPVGWVVETEFLVSDDVGLGGVELSRSINSWGPSTKDLSMDMVDLTQRRATSKDRFDLETLGAKEGDVITYHATTWDNFPGQPNMAQTQVLAIEVISMERFLELQRMQYRIEHIQSEWTHFQNQLLELAEEREEILEQLKPLLENIEAGKQLTEEQRQEMRELQERLAEYRSKALDLAMEMHKRTEQPTLYPFENPYKEMLKDVSQQLQAQAQYAGQAQRSASAFTPGSPPASAAMQKRFSTAVQELIERDRPFTEEDFEQWEQAEQDLERLQLADAMVAAGERIRQVAREQKDLAEQLSEYRLQEKLSPSDALKVNELAQQQRLLQEEMQSATEALEAASEAAAEALPNMSSGAARIAQLATDMQITQDQGDAAQLAQAGVGRYAFESADSAARKLDSLLSDPVMQAGMNPSQCLDGCFSLPRDQIQASLDMMGQSRMIPGLGQRGQDGYGMYGSMANMTMVGPSVGNESDSNTEQEGIGQGNGQGDDPNAGSNAFAEGAQNIDPDQTRTHNSAIMLIPGVPPEYREEAEAYFRRLADDSSQ